MRLLARRCRRGLCREGFSALELAGVIAVIAMVIFLLISWGNHARDRAREISCASNVKQIGLAMHMYAADYGNHLPHSPDAIPYLYAAYVRNMQVFVCPSDENPATIKRPVPEEADEEQDQDKWRPAGAPYGAYTLPEEMECSYFIVPGYTTDDPPTEVIVGDTAARHRGRWNAICLDGRFQSRPAEDLAPYLQWGVRDDDEQAQGVHTD